MNGGDLSAVRKDVESRRDAVIMDLRSDMEEAMRRQLRTLQVLFKEQLDLVSELIAAADNEAATAIWKNEMRFYLQVQRCDSYVLGYCLLPSLMFGTIPKTSFATRWRCKHT